MRTKYTDLHYGQVPILYQALKNEVSKSGTAAIFSLLRCFTYDVDSNDYMIQVLVTASYLERISCLVYKGSDGAYKKLPAEKYKKAIFESCAEFSQEVYEREQTYGGSATEAERIHKMVWQIADLVCPMIACMWEQAFVSEYAYAIDYVIRHRCDLPKPDINELFPRNYLNYNYREGSLVDKIKDYIEL